MIRASIDDLEALLLVAQERSFTRAAAKLGVSQSALSQTVRQLELRLGLRLLTRTTRSVSTTDAGERLVQRVAPRIAEIRDELAGLNDLRDQPAGTIRINAAEHSAETVLWPALAKILPRYPQIKVEVFVENRITDIVAERYDAGIRLGDIVAKDMIAVPIGPDQQMLVVAAPSLIAAHGKPLRPRDLVHYPCINLRLPTRGDLWAWEFAKNGRELKVRVDGQLVFNTLPLMLKAALAGLGFAYLPADEVRPPIERKELVAVLQDWTPAYAGYRLYYARERPQSAAFKVLVEALRRRAAARASPGTTPS